MLRCIHKQLVPVSIKLKTTLRTDKARKIIKNAERNLLQARVKAINSILDNVGKQTELCRSKLVSILSTQRFTECQGFVEKVCEVRFNKVKHRQVTKFNNLLRKEGNITGVSTHLTTLSSSQAGRQSGRQAGAHLLGDSATSKAVSAASQEGSSLAASQAGRLPPSWGQCWYPGRKFSLQGRKQFSGFPDRQAGRHPPSWGQHYFPGSQCSPLGRKQFSGFPGRQAGS